MSNNKKTTTTLSIKDNTTLFTLQAAMGAIIDVPKMAKAIEQEILLTGIVNQPMVLSAVANCYDRIKTQGASRYPRSITSIERAIRRIVTLREEVLTLVNKDEKYLTNSTLVNLVEYCTTTIPRSETERVKLEFYLLYAINQLLPEQQKLINKVLDSKTKAVCFGRGKISNHAFKLLNIGKKLPTDAEKIKHLFAIQLLLVEEIFQYAHRLNIEYVKIAMKYSQWNPETTAAIDQLLTDITNFVHQCKGDLPELASELFPVTSLQETQLLTLTEPEAA